MPTKISNAVRENKSKLQPVLVRLKDLLLFSKRGNDVRYEIRGFFLKGNKSALAEDEMLHLLQSAGCLEIVEIHQEENDRIYQVGGDAAKLNEIEKFLNDEVNDSSKPSKKIGRKIKKLTIAPEGEAGKVLRVAINDDYEHEIKANTHSLVWRILNRVAGNDPEDISKRDAKYACDYVNFNDQCRLYTKTGYKPSKILQIEDDVLQVATLVEIEGIKAPVFERRKNQQMKSA